MSSRYSDKTKKRSFLKPSRTLEYNNRIINKHASRNYIGKSKYVNDESDDDLSKLHIKWRGLRKENKLSKTHAINKNKRKFLVDFITQKSSFTSPIPLPSGNIPLCVKKDPEHGLMIEEQCKKFLDQINRNKIVRKIIDHWLNRIVLDKKYSPSQSISFIFLYVLYSPIKISYFSNGLSLFDDPNNCIKLIDKLSNTPINLPSSLSHGNNISFDRFSIPHKFFNSSLHDNVDRYYNKGCFLQIKMNNSSGFGFSGGSGSNVLSDMNLSDFAHNDLLDKYSTDLRLSIISHFIFKLNSANEINREVLYPLFNDIMSSINYTLFFITNHREYLINLYDNDNKDIIITRLNKSYTLLKILYEMIKKIMVSGRLTSMSNVNYQCRDLIKFDGGSIINEKYEIKTFMRDDHDNDKRSRSSKKRKMLNNDNTLYYYSIRNEKNKKQKTKFMKKLSSSFQKLNK